MKEINNKKRILKIIKHLEREYPNAKIALKYKNPLELLIATILSAQCTDKRVNIVTKDLFREYRTAEDYANADIEELEQHIRSTGFYKNKARNIRAACRILAERYNSTVPKTMREMLSLPGVARKTANVVLGNGYGIVEGIAVDTHVKRISTLLGLTTEKSPEKIEIDLMKIVPRENWLNFPLMLILHGRGVCIAKKPRCEDCILNTLCPSALTLK